jgi:ASCH domain-containing protein
MKGLIIDEPWISLILQGEKIWEMRKTACHHRGRIALIRKGSGQVVGIAALLTR